MYVNLILLNCVVCVCVVCLLVVILNFWWKCIMVCLCGLFVRLVLRGFGCWVLWFLCNLVCVIIMKWVGFRLLMCLSLWLMWVICWFCLMVILVMVILIMCVVLWRSLNSVVLLVFVLRISSFWRWIVLLVVSVSCLWKLMNFVVRLRLVRICRLILIFWLLCVLKCWLLVGGWMRCCVVWMCMWKLVLMWFWFIVSCCVLMRFCSLCVNGVVRCCLWLCWLSIIVCWLMCFVRLVLVLWFGWIIWFVCWFL